LTTARTVELGLGVVGEGEGVTVGAGETVGTGVGVAGVGVGAMVALGLTVGEAVAVGAGEEVPVKVEAILAMNGSWVVPVKLVCSAPVVVGKFAEAVTPPTYTFPAGSSAMHSP
jgi:hypothetical protein